MHEQPTHSHEANRTLARIRPWLAYEFAEHLSTPAWQEFEQRLVAHFPRLFHLLVALYGDHYDLFYHLTQVVTLAAHSWLERSPDLKALDREREVVVARPLAVAGLVSSLAIVVFATALVP